MAARPRSAHGDGEVPTYVGCGRRGHVDGDARGAELNRPFANNAVRLVFQEDPDAHYPTSPNPARRPCYRVQTVQQTGLLAPKGLASSADGRVLFVCDTGHHRLKFAALPAQSALSSVDELLRGVEMFAFAGNGKKGWRDGPVLDCSFNAPTGVCECADGSILVADTGNHCIRHIRRTVAGKLVVRTVAGSYAPSSRSSEDVECHRRGVARELGLRANRASGHRDGLQALFRSPSGVIEGPGGEILVADTMNNCIRGLLRPIHGRLPWEVRTVCGQTSPGHADGSCEAALFDQPVDLCWGKGRSAHTFFVSDRGNACIRQVGRSFELRRGGDCLAFTWVRTIELETIPRAPRPGAFAENGDFSQCSYPLGLACLAESGDTTRETGDCTLVVCDGGENVIKLLPLQKTLEKRWSVGNSFRDPTVTETRAPSYTFSTERLEIGTFEASKLSASMDEPSLENEADEDPMEPQSCSCGSSRALAHALAEIAALQTENMRLKELLQCTFDEIQLADERLSRNQQ